MKLLVLPFGDAACASTHYRVIQYMEMLKADGIECDVAAHGTMPAPAVIAGYDAVLVQKKLFSTRQVRTLRAHAKRLLFDIDDATWHPHGRKHSWWTRWRTNRRLQSIVRAADVSLVANHYIAHHLSALGANAQVLPMALKPEDWPPPVPNPASRIRIGWSGAPVNLRYLEILEPVLEQIMSEHPAAELAVFCGKQPNFSATTPYIYLPWRQGGESAAVETFHIGLLPLPVDSFSQGKSPIKALQYMAAGIPTVATPQAGSFELNRESGAIAFAKSPAEWHACLKSLITETQKREAMGLRARAAYEAHYSTTSTYPLWKSFLMGV
ncbi:MAG: glycosyltransferase [Prosthecobacter sp.]|uniref:glycosyltransferase family protein n=1 Tax=Prosthecobacter sp. TaxID=1965333 RepID=UPI0025D0118C|nr:glycosyltransferase [Prosthecobacter sp.]MCF7787386.1 glycosyltransferase [Prosthecobacter sp.]